MEEKPTRELSPILKNLLAEVLRISPDEITRENFTEKILQLKDGGPPHIGRKEIEDVHRKVTEVIERIPKSRSPEEIEKLRQEAKELLEPLQQLHRQLSI